jgi:hypothetical protein
MLQCTRRAPLKGPHGRRTGTNKRSPGLACGYRGARFLTPAASLIFGTDPMDLERAALLADQLLARIVYEDNVRRAAGRRGFAIGRLRFPPLTPLCGLCRATANVLGASGRAAFCDLLAVDLTAWRHAGRAAIGEEGLERLTGAVISVLEQWTRL